MRKRYRSDATDAQWAGLAPLFEDYWRVEEVFAGLYNGAESLKAGASSQRIQADVPLVLLGLVLRRVCSPTAKMMC